MKIEYNPRHNLKKTLPLVLGALFVLYGVFQSRNLIIGPRITVSEPKNGFVVNDPVVSVRGTTKNIAYINLNDGQIFVDDLGHFNEKLMVSPGYNIMKLSAEDKFGRATEKFIEIIFEPKEVASFPSTDLDIQNI
jgi:hypothetical protein